MGMFSQLAQGVDWTSLGTMVLRIAAVLVCLVVHEVCHGLAAYRLGDPTAKQSHRLSLNPIHHLDPFGLLMMVVVGFGWAKPVPVDPRYFRNPKQGMALTALAGPVSNFVLAYLSAVVYSALYAVAAVRGEGTALSLALEFFALMLTLNIGLGIFNLIPFPPLDGSKVVAMFLTDRNYIRWMQLERYGMIVLMAVLWFGFLDGFLMTARNWMLEGMLQGSAFAYKGMLSLLL